uniref:Uncharacterized protein n=1 Tax=Populus trichocarpa TaxID=3694 RepID=U5GJU0_POPTR
MIVSVEALAMNTALPSNPIKTKTIERNFSISPSTLQAWLVYVQTNRAFVLWPSRATEPFLKYHLHHCYSSLYGIKRGVRDWEGKAERKRMGNLSVVCLKWQVSRRVVLGLRERERCCLCLLLGEEERIQRGQRLAAPIMGKTQIPKLSI